MTDMLITVLTSRVHNRITAFRHEMVGRFGALERPVQRPYERMSREAPEPICVTVAVCTSTTGRAVRRPPVGGAHLQTHAPARVNSAKVLRDVTSDQERRTAAAGNPGLLPGPGRDLAARVPRPMLPRSRYSRTLSVSYRHQISLRGYLVP